MQIRLEMSCGSCWFLDAGTWLCRLWSRRVTSAYHFPVVYPSLCVCEGVLSFCQMLPCPLASHCQFSRKISTPDVFLMEIVFSQVIWLVHESLPYAYPTPRLNQINESLNKMKFNNLHATTDKDSDI